MICSCLPAKTVAGVTQGLHTSDCSGLVEYFAMLQQQQQQQQHQQVVRRGFDRSDSNSFSLIVWSICCHLLSLFFVSAFSYLIWLTLGGRVGDID